MARKIPHISRGGRALSLGVQTRASLLVRRVHRGQGRPLPFELQCYPPAMARTPAHPGCVADMSAAGILQSILKTRTPYALLLGVGLKPVGDWEIQIFGISRGQTFDSQYALAFAWAATTWGMRPRLLRR